jgi:DNA-directed RNA polymerase III subunit RPC1
VTKTKNYSKEREGRPQWNDLCPEDGYVIIHDGELLTGAVDKSVLGSGSKNNIFYVMLRDISSDSAAKAMWRLGRVTSFFLANRGFSLGIDDVTPTNGLLHTKGELLQAGYSAVTDFIKKQQDGQLEPQPGQTTEQTLEVVILKELSGIREAAGKTCVKELGRKNAPLLMAMCGSKGSLINVSQMVACVGQQAIRGARVPDGFGDRSLPYFDHREKTPLAKGFVENSFYSGLTATEFFFHTMAGREGLLDTAVKTAETGYMQRRLVKALEDLVSHYDGSVRNSRGDVVQFMYGDDYLDPVNMEDNNRPVNFKRLLSHVRCLFPCHHEVTMRPDDIVELASTTMKGWTAENVSTGFKQDILEFLVQKRETLMKYMNRPDYHSNKAIQSIDRITATQLAHFLDRALDKYLKAVLEPGTAVGAICAQSIGEPATQMTLKTFHFAGVASMNITQGVPRIKELINANKTISTPIIRAALLNPKDQEEARAVKMRLEKTTLGQVCQFMDQVVLPDDSFVLIKLYTERIKILKLEINEDSVAEAIVRQLKISENRIEVPEETVIIVRPKATHELYQLRESLMNVVVKGFKNIKRAAIRIDDKDDNNHYLAIEGEGLRDVMATYGVDPTKTTSNNVLEVAACLGVEAARTTIIKEINETMCGHGIGIDERHLKLLADTMTYRGEVLGITRFGLAKMKESALMLASVSQHLLPC